MTLPNAGEEVEKQDYLFIIEGNVKWYNHSGKLFASLKIINGDTSIPKKSV